MKDFNQKWTSLTSLTSLTHEHTHICIHKYAPINPILSHLKSSFFDSLGVSYLPAYLPSYLAILAKLNPPAS